MFDTRNNSSCGFGDEIIAYLYKEMGTADRKVFEEHLETCTHCPGELAAFSTVSGAIHEWKSAKFDPLATPQDTFSGAVNENISLTGSGEPLSVFAKLQGLFSGLPGTWQTASAFAVIALAIGLGWILLGGLFNPGQLAVVPPAEEKTSNPPVDIPEMASNDPADVPVSNGQDENSNMTRPAVKPAISRKAESGNTSKKKVVRENRKPVPRKNPGNPDSKKRLPVNKAPEAIPAVPRLTELAENDDTEDNGLRLSDLFAGTEER